MTALARKLIFGDEIRRQAIAEELLEAVRFRLQMLSEHDANPSEESKRLLRWANERLDKAEQAATLELGSLHLLRD
jgi:hypothetical protein